MSLTTDTVWASGVWDPGVWAECVWYEPQCTVTTTVSPTGGWSLWVEYEKEMLLRKREAARKRKLLEKAKKLKLKNELDKELAEELQKAEEERQRREELNRLRILAERHRDYLREIGIKVYEAAERAIEKQTYSSMERLERELRAAREEEEFLMMAIRIIINA